MTWTLTKTIRAVMAAYVVTFLAAGIVFLSAPDWTVDQGTRIGELEAKHFWLATTIGLMALLVHNSYLVYRDPARYAHVLGSLGISKLASSMAAILLAAVHSEPGLWLVAAADLPLAFVAAVLWNRGRRL